MSSVRISIPADLYNSGIHVEVEGVEACLQVVSDSAQEGKDAKEPSRGSRRRGGLAKGSKANRPRSTQSLIHDPGGDPNISNESESERSKGHIPITVDLAQSFLQTEPAHERAELQAVLARSQSLHQSEIGSDDGDEDLALGVGSGFSLPAFLADFLKGIGDRLQVEVSNVCVDLDFTVDLPNESSTNSRGSTKSETVTFRLLAGKIRIDGVTTCRPTTDLNEAQIGGAKQAVESNLGEQNIGSRCISLHDIQLILIAETSLFVNFSQFSAPPSPSSTHTSAFHKSTAKPFHEVSSESSTSSASLTMTKSVVLNSTMDGAPSVDNLKASMATSNGGRFADAMSEEAEDYDQRSLGHSMQASSLVQSQYQESELETSIYLDQAGAMMFSKGIEDSDTLPEALSHDYSKLSRASRDPTFRDPGESTSPSRRYQPGIRDESGSPRPQHSTTRPPFYEELAPTKGVSAWSIDNSHRLPISHRSPHHSLVVSNLKDEQRATLSRQSSNPDSSAPEDLTQSKIFSHEEVESMYMSAISRISDNESQERDASRDSDNSSPDRFESLEPGESSDNRFTKELAGSTVAQANSSPDNSTAYRETSDKSVPELKFSTTSAQAPSIQTTGSNLIPQGHRGSETWANSSKPSQNSLRSCKCFITVHSATLELPQTEKIADTFGQNVVEGSQSTGARFNPGIPGAFSQLGTSVMDDETTNRRQGYMDDASQQDNGTGSSKVGTGEATLSDSRPISIDIMDMSIFGDMGLTRLMVMVAQQMSALKSPTETKKNTESGSTPLPMQIAVSINTVSWKFLDALKGVPDVQSSYLDTSADATPSPLTSDVLLSATVKNLHMKQVLEKDLSRTELSVGRFRFGYASNDIISFDNDIKMRESKRDIDAALAKDLTMKLEKSSQMMEVNIETLPLRVTLDLARLDETFGWFGGLSGVLGLGSSMMSTVTIVDTKSKSHKSTQRPRGVRFETPSTQKHVTGSPSQQKVTARIGGILFDLQGKDAALRFRSTAMKTVSRTEGIGLQVDKIKLSGPHVSSNDSLMNVQLNNVRTEYLNTPLDADLLRLVALLSPSKDKYETDDDILLDTLIRQRRQGGLVRINVEKVDGNLSNLHDHHHFLAIVEELSKFSSVTKYLPEDDRPGILTLGSVRDLCLNVNTNETFGTVHVKSQNLEIAHVTLPSLISIGVGNVHVSRQQSLEIVGEALPVGLDGKQPSPMIMARFIGDEMEPTVKIKIWNMKVEYHVSTIMALMGISENTTTGEIVSEMVNSVATLTMKETHEPPRLSSQTSFRSERSSGPSKTPKLDITLRDSIIGLNPRNLPSRGLLVLTNTSFVTSMPKSNDVKTNAILEIRKASLLVIDNVESAANNKHSESLSSHDPKTQVQKLSEAGYVPVSYISAAKVSIDMVSSGQDTPSSIDVEIRDDLLVLETCADSTQTLQAILNGLKPPMPPSKELKYRTEIVPVEDMLASFSGDAFAAPVNNDLGGDEYVLGLDEGDMMDDEVPQNLEFVSSFYNPDPAPSSDYLANSMLEGDLGSITSQPATREIGDRRLLQSFQEQYEVDPSSEPLDFQEDHFGVGSTVGGTAHRWNTNQNTYDLSNEVKVRGSPMRIRVRDVHVIWNLFDGYDWQHTRDTISQAVADVESKAEERLARRGRRRSFDVEEEEDSEIGDFLFNSIYIGIPANRDPRELARQVNRNLDDVISETESYATSTISGSPSRQSQVPRTKRKRLRLHRSKHHKMTFELKGVCADVIVFPPGSGETQSSIDVRVQDLEIFDHVPTSTWKKFLTYMHDAGDREAGTSMVHLEILNVKPVADLAASEIILKVGCKATY